MSNYVDISNSTIITGATASRFYFVGEVNNKLIGIPYFNYIPAQTTPDIDFVNLLTVDIDIHNTSVVNNVTSYGAGIAMNINGSAFAMPIFRVDQNPDFIPSLVFSQPTLVSNLTSTGTFLVVKKDNVAYGIPLYNYSSVYPFTTSQPQSSINITTIIAEGPPLINRINTSANSKAGSTNLNSKIQTYSQLIHRIKTQLGYPFVNIEVCEDVQIVDFIDIAMEWFTKYAGYTEEYLVFNSELYKEPGLRIDQLFSLTASMRNTMSNNVSASWDYDLGDYRKVIGIFDFQPGQSTGINTLFTLEQAMAQQTYFSYMLGNAGFDLVTWEVLKQWLDLREKILAQKHYVDFDQYNQLLRLIPGPTPGHTFYGVVGCWVEKPIAQLISEQWVQKYALALTKIAVGNIRGKYQGMQMFGGGTINYNDLLSQGLKEKDELEKGLQDGSWYETAPPRFFLG